MVLADEVVALNEPAILVHDLLAGGLAVVDVCLPTTNAPSVGGIGVFVVTRPVRAEQLFRKIRLKVLHGTDDFLGGFLGGWSNSLCKQASRDREGRVFLLVVPAPPGT